MIKTIFTLLIVIITILPSSGQNIDSKDIESCVSEVLIDNQDPIHNTFILKYYTYKKIDLVKHLPNQSFSEKEYEYLNSQFEYSTPLDLTVGSDSLAEIWNFKFVGTIKNAYPLFRPIRKTAFVSMPIFTMDNNMCIMQISTWNKVKNEKSFGGNYIYLLEKKKGNWKIAYKGFMGLKY